MNSKISLRPYYKMTNFKVEFSLLAIVLLDEIVFVIIYALVKCEKSDIFCWKIFIYLYKTVKMNSNLSKQSKLLVKNLINYFEQEKSNNGPFLPLNCVRERVSQALKLSLNTISRISATDEVESPKRRRPRKKSLTLDLSRAEQSAIRNEVYEMYKNREQVTLNTLLEKLKSKNKYNGSRSSLAIGLKVIGFKYKKDDPRRGLMEKDYIVHARINFLHETWVFQDGIITHSWQDDNVKSVKKTKVNGKRFIILHAGTSDGWVKGASVFFSGKSDMLDYHGEMNEKNFLGWMENQLLKNLENPSLIIMDNASYHSTISKKNPQNHWKKEEIKEWLQSNNINFDQNALKPQLLQLVKMHQPKKIYIADELVERYGHKVLRLPPYHCIFNAIENIWGIAKNYYNTNIGRDGGGVENARQMWEEAIEHVTPQMWENTVAHTEKTILEWWDREKNLDASNIAPIVFDCNESSSSEDSDI